MKTHILGLKELRENMQKYASLVEKGQSFIIVRKSKPVFKIVPPESEEEWETIADFTKINKNGVDAKEILKILRKLNAHLRKGKIRIIFAKNKKIISIVAIGRRNEKTYSF